MYQLREGIDVRTSRLGSIGTAVRTCAVAGPAPAFVARPWRGSLTSTMPSLGEGHAKGHEAILANGTRRLKEPST